MQNDVFHTETQSTALVVAPLVNISSLPGDQVQAELDRVLTEFQLAQKKNVVLDFTRVGYFGSVMLAAAQTIWKRVRAAQGKMVLCGLSEVARDVLRVSSFDQIWPIYVSRDEAVQSLEAIV